MDILETCGATAAASVLQPKLVEFIGPLFKIMKGTTNLLEAVLSKPDQITEMLKDIQKAVDHLTEQSERLAQGLGQLIRGDKAYQKITFYVESYHTSLFDEGVESSIRGGLRDQLRTLQDMITKPTPLNPNQKPWIVYISNHCQSNSPSDDPTWGAKAASNRFAAILAFQRMAIMVLKKVGVSADDLATNVDEQVDMFVAAFKKCWNSDVGKVKLARRFPCYDSISYGHISDNHFYNFVAAKSDKSAAALLVIDLSNFKTTSRGMYNLTNHREECRIVVHGDHVYTVDYATGILQKIDLTTRQMDSVCAHMTFHWKSKMVCHEESLYAISSGGELCKIDLETEYLDILSSGWSTSKWGSTALTSLPDNHRVYATAEGKKDNSFFIIDPSKHESKNELRAGCYFTTMAHVGHGKHLYVIDDRKIYAYNVEDNSYTMITPGDVYAKHFSDNKIYVHLLQQGLTLYVQVNNSKNMELYLVKPYFSLLASY